jgi:hypothetical protein
METRIQPCPGSAFACDLAAKQQARNGPKLGAAAERGRGGEQMCDSEPPGDRSSGARRPPF